MPKKILSSPLFYPLLLIALCLLIAAKNYTPGTFLTGWDTLHPEFDFSLNFQRLLFGVWRSEQGFGAVSGHSAMADLPRVALLWLFHFVLPLNFLRYSYIFLCLILGPLGIYFLLKQLFANNHVSFLVALFYIFNLSTVQQFYVPFEMFPTQWAFLPWIIFFALRYLESPSRRDLIFFGLATLLAAPQAYAAHLWYPFFGAFTLFVMIFKFNRHSFRLILLTLLLNSFWLLPNLYFAVTSSSIPVENQQNRLHSQEFLLKNRETGTLSDSMLIRGFYFNWDMFDFRRDNTAPLMQAWNDHLGNLDIRLIGYTLFFLSLSGLILAAVRRDRHLLAFAPFFVIPFILLANRTFPFNLVFELLLKSPILQEILRFIFSKISVLMLFGQAVFLGYLLINISQYVKTIHFRLIFTLALIIYALPVLEGQLISPLTRVKIPQSYFQLWEYLQHQPQGKILGLPLHDAAGWIYTTWGYQGSGLIWFGLPQAITDRDSDRWSPYNEEAYREFFTALYSDDAAKLANVIAKYKIGYLLWDRSLTTTFPKNQDQITYRRETEALLSQLVDQNLLSPPRVFDNLYLYSLTALPAVVQAGQNLPNVTPAYHWQYIDYAYQSADYQTDPLKPAAEFPFRNILNRQNRLDPALFDPASLASAPLNYPAEAIQALNNGAPNLSLDRLAGTLNIYTDGSTHGINLEFPVLSHEVGYIVAVRSRFLSGLPLRLCFRNTYTGICLIEDELTKNPSLNWDYFLIPPSDNNFGFNLSLNAISYGGVLSSTDVADIKVYPFDYAALSRASTQIAPGSTVNLNTSNYINQSLFIIPSPPSSPATLILNESYNSAWLAFYFQGLKPVFLKNHVLINNWANGWSLPDHSLSSPIYIFFWPQLLELFGLLTVPLVFIFLPKNSPIFK